MESHVLSAPGVQFLSFLDEFLYFTSIAQLTSLVFHLLKNNPPYVL